MTDAVLLLAFNRPELLTRVIDAVRPARPPRIYLAVDGPRTERPDDLAAVSACRDLAEAIDWGAEVHTLFRERNLGCGLGVSTAISWFFEHEELGIVLEDDVLPNEDFFPFMTTLLDRYRHDPRVFAVTGSSFVPASLLSGANAYRFSRFPYVWGWGTWRRTWNGYHLGISDWRAQLGWGELRHLCGGSTRAALHWSRVFDDCAAGRVDTWDGQLVLASLLQGGLTAVSNTNLTTNVGFASDATHTRRAPAFLMPSGRTTLPLDEQQVVPDERADRWTVKHQLGATVPRFVSRELRRAKMSLPIVGSVGLK